jgi:hypothetical protein
MQTMPPKAASDLTKVEMSFLAVAARLHQALIVVSEGPLSAERTAHFNAKVWDEIVSTSVGPLPCTLTDSFPSDLGE